MERKFGIKRNPSDLAAFSLQAKVTIKGLKILAEKAGAPLSLEELSEVKEIRRTLRKQYSMAVYF